MRVRDADPGVAQTQAQRAFRATGSALGSDATLLTLRNAIRLLDQFSVDEPVLGTSDLARRLGLAKSTVHRLVSTLAAHGLLAHTDGGRYRLGMHLYELASLIPASLEPREVAIPRLKWLMQAAQETVHLAIRDGAEVVYIEKFEANRTIRMYSRVGRRAPMYCTGIGKAILAHEPEAVVARVVACGLRAFTRHTITDKEQLREELRRIREAGYALDREEIEEGLRCVAAPILDYTGHVVAGISVAGPSQRLTPETVRRLIPLVVETGQAISRELGFRERRG